MTKPITFLLLVLLFFSCVENEKQQEQEVISSSKTTEYTPACLMDDKGYIIQLFLRSYANRTTLIYLSWYNRDYIFTKSPVLLNKDSDIKDIFASLEADNKLVVIKRPDRDPLAKLNRIFYDSIYNQAPIFIKDSIEVKVFPCYIIYRDTTISFEEYCDMVSFHSHSASFIQSRFRKRLENITMERKMTMISPVLICTQKIIDNTESEDDW